MAIIECLEAEKISVGQKTRDIDCTKIEYLLRENFEDIAWVSASIDHTRLCIDIKESLYDEYPIVKEKDTQYDFVANKDANIYSIVTRSGKASVKKGDTVKKGDILVVGQCNIYDDIGEIKSVQYVKADAQIVGDVTYDFHTHISEMEIIALKIAGVYTEEMLLQIANQKLLGFIEILEENGVIILDNNVMIDINEIEKEITISGKVYARELIGTNILVEEIIENDFE